VRGGLAHELLDRVRVQGVHDPVEEVTIRVALVVFGASGVWQVLLEQRQIVDDLRVDQLDGQLRPVRDVARGYVLLLQSLLATREDVLKVLQARGLERREQVAYCK